MERILDGNMSEHDSEPDEGPPCVSPTIVLEEKEKTHYELKLQQITQKKLMKSSVKTAICSDSGIISRQTVFRGGLLNGLPLLPG